jgi:dTDP-4-amino-4,6-dideoxygalactose transaminase
MRPAAAERTGTAGAAPSAAALSRGPVAPPTAGLPLRWSDLRPGGDDGLAPALARFLGLDEVAVTCSGTAALAIALTALRRLAPGRDAVVAPAYTCPLVALAVARCGLRLVLCDLLPGSLDLDPAGLEACCDARTLAILPTHLGGRVGDAGPARARARAVGARVIEDAAQALGARVDGRCIGADSDIVFFSLAVGKGLTIFEGGVLAVRDPALRAACADAARALAPPRIGWELRRSVELLGYAALYRPAGLGWAYGRPLRRALARGDWVEAAGDDFDPPIPLHAVGRWRRAVGVRALARLPGFLDDGRRRAAARCDRLRAIAGLRLLGDSPAVAGAEGTWPVLLALLPDPAVRDWLLARLWGAGCGLSLPFAQALPDYGARYAAVVPATPPQALPHARSLAGRLLAVSNSPWLDDARFETVAQAIEGALQGG